MKRVLIFGALVMFLKSPAQPVPVELMAGHQSVWYQHSYGKAVTASGLGFFNTSSLLQPWCRGRVTELMSQSYLTYPVGAVKAGLGFFYASVPGFRPSLNLQITAKIPHGFVVMVPRIDLCKQASYDLMVLAESKPPLNNTWRLHVKFQTMLNFAGSRHNRSYQNFRIGVAQNAWQAGLAVNFDAYSDTYQYRSNVGMYLKKDL